MTITLFPLLYLTLELPKRIINDAIGSDGETVAFFGVALPQVTYLMALCGIFLLAVLVHGLMKMRINTMKGVLAERLLRRFRFTLIARILRFPAPYFERTSQGELVSMVTSESEPLGGLMGDAVAQPVLQAGQMITILGFLFVQSVTFGLAACALIPIQAWIIPKLQRQINLLNKKRVVQLRALAAEIGEGAAGSTALRTHGGWRYRMAMISDRLGRLYSIRFEIFQKKFFMKFANNFITQLTPFFFYAVGGYLVIKGEITFGALVAALAAYKDLSSPWKELLAYYTQYQDMSLRWQAITERFAPPGMIEATLFNETPDEIPSLAGDIELKDVSVRDDDGNAVLDKITVTLPAGSSVAITAPNDEDRRALCALLTRELTPSSGKVLIAGHDLSRLHQATVAARIGHATSRPALFFGTLGENILMPLKYQPKGIITQTDTIRESARAGNSTEPLDADWLDMAAARVSDADQLRNWWFDLVQGMGSADVLFRRGLDLRIDPEIQDRLAQALVDLRPEVAKALTASGLNDHAWVIHPATYNPAFPVIDNLLFGAPRRPITADVLAEQTKFLDLLAELTLEDDLLQLAVDIVEMLRQTFGFDGTDHPLFRKLGLDAGTYEAAISLIARQKDRSTLTAIEKAQLLIVPFAISAEKIGPAFPPEIIDRVLQMRHGHGDALRASMRDLFVPLVADQPVAGLSVLENALFGRVSEGAGRKGDELRLVVGNVLRQEGLESLVLSLIFDMPIALGGLNLPAQIAEPLAVSRAMIKCPDVLILDSVLSSHEASVRQDMYGRLRKLLPEATMICLERSFADPSSFDLQLELKQGRISAESDDITSEEDSAISVDQARKMRALEQTDLFNGLDRKQLRLLAFGARWYSAQRGEYVFHQNDQPTSGAYLIIEGEADLLMPQADGESRVVSAVGPGMLVGELGLIRNVPRALDMLATTDLSCLRISAEDFLAVVENDAATSYKLLQVVAGYLTS
ncbi:ABC transporter ATP-binding protein [Sulfitobacter sp. SK012]|nr:ABC transporter ATP-binding protein [Sulfitobacter sp. SK012]